MLQTISITVSGKVQGVFFRQSTKDVANQLSIKGEVRNLSNGNVRVIATGTKEQLDKLIQWCKKGPPRAEVTGVDVQEVSLQTFHQFMIVH